MKVFYDATRDLISVEGTGAVWPARSLTAAAEVGGVSIMMPNGVTRVLGPLAPGQVERLLPDGSYAACTDAASALAYLDTTFSTSRSDQPLTASGAVFGGHGVMFDGPSGCRHADPATPGYVFAGVATQSVAAGSAVVVRRRDGVTFSAWSWTPGLPVFALPQGALTQDPPDAGVSHQVGIALDPTTLLIAPCAPIAL